MRKEADFLIKHYEYFNEKGEVTYQYYYIQERKKFLRWQYWKDIRHKEWTSEHYGSTRTRFATIGDAQKFVREVLCLGIPVDSSRVTTVDEMVCKN